MGSKSIVRSVNVEPLVNCNASGEDGGDVVEEPCDLVDGAVSSKEYPADEGNQHEDF